MTRAYNATHLSIHSHMFHRSPVLFALSYVKVARSSSGSVDRAIFSRLPSPEPLSRDEHRLQGRVQINIKLNYNDSVYRGAAHSRALHRQPLFAMDGTNPATARLVIFYAMYINTAMPRGPRARVHVFVSGRFYAAKSGCGRHVDVFLASSRRRYTVAISCIVKRHYEPMASTRRETCTTIGLTVSRSTCIFSKYKYYLKERMIRFHIFNLAVVVSFLMSSFQSIDKRARSARLFGFFP